jgi:DNA replication protein DnaC
MRDLLPKNDAGEAFCRKCSAIIPPPDVQCEACIAAAKREEDRRRRCHDINVGFQDSAGWRHDSSDAKLPRWEWARFDNDEFRNAVSQKLLRAVERWEPSMGNLVLCSDTGAGKTSLYVAKVHSVYKREFEIAKTGEKDNWWRFTFVTALDLVAARRGHKLGTSEPRIIRQALETNGVLILDEVGYEDLRDQLILEIADARYKNKAPTILTTGRKPEEFAARYGAACWRRFTEGGNVVEDFGKVAST